MSPAPLVTELTATVLMGALIVSLALLSIRLFRGPGLADRVVVLDTASYVVVATTATLGLATGQGAFLDVGLVVGIVAFLATVAFGRHLEREGARDATEERPR